MHWSYIKPAGLHVGAVGLTKTVGVDPFTKVTGPWFWVFCPFLHKRKTAIRDMVDMPNARPLEGMFVHEEIRSHGDGGVWLARSRCSRG